MPPPARGDASIALFNPRGGLDISQAQPESFTSGLEGRNRFLMIPQWWDWQDIVANAETHQQLLPRTS
jgi:hypothetical protein